MKSDTDTPTISIREKVYPNSEPGEVSVRIFFQDHDEYGNAEINRYLINREDRWRYGVGINPPRGGKNPHIAIQLLRRTAFEIERMIAEEASIPQEESQQEVPHVHQQGQ